MGGRGSGSGMAAYRRNVRSSEDTIRNEPVEHLLLLDKDGKIAMRTGDGKRGEVEVTPEMMRRARDSVMTHNHPGGSTFSKEDIQTSLQLGLREIRATTAKNGTFSLRRDYDLNTPQPSFYRSFAAEYDTYVKYNIQRVLQSQIFRREITVDEAIRRDGVMRREWLRDNAKKYGWTYKEEK